MKKTIMLLWALLFCSMNMYQAFPAEIREQSHTKEEVKRMKNTNAVIQTKLGDITLKFFPGVAPNHVNNFIELAEKGFYLRISCRSNERSLASLHMSLTHNGKSHILLSTETESYQRDLPFYSPCSISR